MMIFGAIRMVLSQIPNFQKLSWLSILSAVMSFVYSSIGLVPVADLGLRSQEASHSFIIGNITSRSTCISDRIMCIFNKLEFPPPLCSVYSAVVPVTLHSITILVD
ncbi:hypothetical protein LguiA_004041 [Lonicera macranthoides]